MEKNSVIRVLSKDVADLIAAGEVVERPLSVVKELLENSIDAGSTSVTVEITKGGKEYIRVSDNGCGISKGDLPVAMMRYATSKINRKEDLNNIGTLGFRGEALYSIAAVSEMEILSKQKDMTAGAKIRLTGGELDSISDAACEEGTTVIVRNLFFNTPARRKFLKPDNTEASLIISFVSRMAIANPMLKIRMISNGSILFSTNGKGDLYQTLQTVFSPQDVRKLVPVNCSNQSDLKLTGYISSPTNSKTNRKSQIFFVNGRLIKSKIFDNALSLAYRDKLFEGHYPLAFLFLQCDPADTDVNIHPHKEEIRFFNENEIEAFIVDSVRKALLNPEALDYKASEIKSSQYSDSVNQNEASVPYVMEKREAEVFDNAKDVVLSEEIPAKNNESKLFGTMRQIEQENDFKDDINIEEKTERIVQESFIDDNETGRFSFSALEYIGQAFSTYLLCKDKDNLYLIDQHAAHERVTYEKLLSDFNSAENSSQILLTPFVTDVSISDKADDGDILNALRSMSFVIEDFGPSSYIVKEIPVCLDLGEAQRFIETYFETAASKGYVQLKHAEIISRSCKAAVKAHDNLSYEEVRAIFTELDKCENPFSCPHGRPTFIKFSNYEIERMFKRK